MGAILHIMPQYNILLHGENTLEHHQKSAEELSHWLREEHGETVGNVELLPFMMQMEISSKAAALLKSHKLVQSVDKPKLIPHPERPMPKVKSPFR